MHNLTLEHNKVTPASKTRSSSLSQAFAAFNINSDAQVRNRSHPGLVVSPLPALPEANLRRNSVSNMETLQDADMSIGTPAQNIPGATSSTESESDSDSEPKSAGDISEKKLRAYCSSPQPPTFLKPGGNLPPTLKAARRRSTLADNPEIYHSLAASRVQFEGQRYLPLTAQTFKTLSPLWTGAKPMADLALFKYLIIDLEVNATHGGPVLAALERIGGHCQQLVVTVARELDIHISTEWLKFFRALPNLKTIAVALNKPAGVPTISHHHIIESIKAALDMVYEPTRMPFLTVV